MTTETVSAPTTAQLDEQAMTRARLRLREGVYTREGIICPCCKRLAKVYKRRINKGMIRALIAMVKAQAKLPEGEYVKVGKNGQVHTSGGDYGKLHNLWGLIEPKPGDDRRVDGSKRVGYWRVTKAGLMFVRGEVAVRKYLFEFGGTRVRDPDDADTSLALIGALVDEYDYDEMMAIP